MRRYRVVCPRYVISEFRISCFDSDTLAICIPHIQGDLSSPVLVTYHDIGLDRASTVSVFGAVTCLLVCVGEWYDTADANTMVTMVSPPKTDLLLCGADPSITFPCTLTSSG